MDKYAYGDVHVYIQRIIDTCKDTYKFHSSEDEAKLDVSTKNGDKNILQYSSSNKESS